jgi:hypothetical protein
MKAILVGSKDARNWQGKLEKNLSTVGVEIVGVWRKPGDPAKRGVFAGATGILLTNDCCSHTLQDAAKIEARKNNLPLIVINHRWSSCSQILAKHGITAQSSAEKAQGESNMGRGRQANGPSKAEWKDILRPIVAENPQISMAKVVALTSLYGMNGYTRDSALREVRKELGWAWSKRAAAFVQAAETPAETPPAPEPTPTPSEPAEAPTEPATGLHGDVQAALALLLATMQQHGVEHVELWANGKAEFRRKVVTYTSGTMNVTAEEL